MPPARQTAATMNARDIDTASAQIESLQHRVRHCVIASGVVAGVAAAAVPFSSGFAIALGVGVIIQLALAGIVWLRRRERIEKLALEPAAYVIPAVARFGARIGALRVRRQLATAIHALVHERGHPLELHLVVRAARYTNQLETLARELASPSARVEPATAVACRRLITRPVESPLYNPNLPEEDLRALLLRLRAGISSGQRDGLTL
jgi:hypothetical protein